jgi:hypothetical protein
MSQTATVVKPTKANIGVFTNPKHDLWISDAEPAVESVQKQGTLKPGEVTIAVKSTGICGYVPCLSISSLSQTDRRQIRCPLLACRLYWTYDCRG